MRDRELSFREHLQELRRRLLICVLALIVCTGLALAFYRPLLQVLLHPVQAKAAELGAEIVFIEVTEMFGVLMKTAIVAGIVGASPVIMYEIIAFVAPGLTRTERRYLMVFLPGAMLAFAAGVVFGYFVLLPPALRFLLSFGSDIARPMIRIGNYVNVVVMLLFWIGLAFETPLVMLIISKIGLVTHRGFAHWRRYWFVAAFLLGAIITPTFDPVNQTLVAAPLIVLYEIGIWLSRLFGKKRAPAEGPTRQMTAAPRP